MSIHSHSAGTLLSWRLGIAHSDVGLGDIMVKKTEEGGVDMIVNDFDLASVMNPGDKHARRRGLERTGTKPFMAVDLLKKSDGSVLRLCRHDLESVIWVLVGLCFEDHTWYEHTHQQVHMYKLAYLSWATRDVLPKNIKEKYTVLWTPVTDIVDSWLSLWGKANRLSSSESLSEDGVLDVVNQYFPCPAEYSKWDWRRFGVVPQL